MSSTSGLRHTSYRICGISDCASLGGNPGNPRKPPETLRKPFHLSAGNPHRVLTNVNGRRSTGTIPLANSRHLEGLLRQTQDDDVLLVAEPAVVGRVRQALPRRCKIIRMKSQDTPETNARLLPCLCDPGCPHIAPAPGPQRANQTEIGYCLTQTVSYWWFDLRSTSKAASEHAK